MRSRLRHGSAVTELDGRLEAVCQWVGSQLGSGTSFLDIGCGFGWVEEYLLKNPTNAQIYALEPTEEAFSEFRKRINDPRVTTVVASALDLPLANDSIDLCLSTEVLEHIPTGTERQFFSEIARVLKPGGRALITTPNSHPISKFTDPAWWILNHRHYSIDSVCDFALSAGLVVDAAEARGSWSELTALYDLYLSKWVFARKPMLARLYSERLTTEWRKASDSGFMGIWLEVSHP